MAKNWNWWSRKLHRWGAILTLLPMLLVIVSGLLLQVKKQVTWVQPKTVSGSVRGEAPVVDWRSILDAASGVKEAEISSWDDVDRLDVRPGKGVVKVQSKNSWEVQVDLRNAEVLTFNYRRSDWIESLHDGSYFSDYAKLWVFLPNGLILLGLWGTGLWLWYLPFLRRKKNAK
ncbi:MAG: PepSY-associated TM helix domain-containing protein [Planctomycetota bacterium]|nr:PepSY-associated TM helix domain-containing protein [Planctomycetota bacterium]